MPDIRLEFAVPVEGRPDQPLSAYGYLFDARDRLIARGPLADGAIALDVDPALLRRVRLLVAPAEADLPAAPSLDALRRLGAYEPPLTIRPDVKRYELKPLPPEIWKRWLLWGVLVVGAALVAGFAVSLLRGKPAG